MRESKIRPPPGSKRVEIRSTTSRSRLGWLCVHHWITRRRHTHGLGCGRRSSSHPRRTHRQHTHTHTQQSTVTTTTKATTTTKSGGGQQRPSSSSSSWLRQERNKKGEIQAKPRNVALDSLVGPIARHHRDNTNDSACWLSESVAGQKKSTARQIKQGVCTEAQPARTYTQARAD